MGLPGNLSPSLATNSPTYGQALSQEELNVGCEIARVIMASTVTMTNSFGVNNVFTNVDALLSQVTTFMQALAPDAAQAVRDCINRYRLLRFTNISLQGDVGVVRGINISADRERERIREVFLLYVPVMTFAEAQIRRAKAIDPAETDGGVGRVDRG